MMATTSNEMDQMFKKALRLLYSSHPNSATELREMLDEVIKQKYGAEKMLCNTLSKRHLDLEKNFPGRAATPVPQTPQSTQNVDEIINLTNSPAKTISDSPDTIADSDDCPNGAAPMDVVTAGDDDGNLKEFGDLNCCVCGEMVFTASNRLIECSKCGSLYHQECHKPTITNEEASEDQQHTWQCDNCFNKPSTSKAAGIIVIPDEQPIPVAPKPKTSAASSRSSSSSNSSSPFYKVDQQQPTSQPTIANINPPTTSKHTRRSSPSSTKSHKEVHGSKSSVSSHEKSSHSTSSSRKSHSSSSKSSSKSSKHHDTSSSKRRNK